MQSAAFLKKMVRSHHMLFQDSVLSVPKKPLPDRMMYVFVGILRCPISKKWSPLSLLKCHNSKHRRSYFPNLLIGRPNLHLSRYLPLIHISDPTRLRRTSYAVFCLKKKKPHLSTHTQPTLLHHLHPLQSTY